MKQRFTALDIGASVQDIKSKLVGLRLQNVYDINSKTFLLKFSLPDKKEYLVVESGIRLHLTAFSREKAVTPSQFCTKLRKHLRTRRLTNVRQAGVDRIVQFEFSAAAGPQAPGSFHLICEFFASGNIILVDHEFKVQTLLRVVKTQSTIENKKEQEKKKPQNKNETASLPENAFSLAVKDIYELDTLSREFEPGSSMKVAARLRDLIEGNNTEAKNTKKNKKEGKETLKKVVNAVCLYGPPLSEHCLIEAELDPNLSVKDASINLDADSDFMKKLDVALNIGDRVVLELNNTPAKGYILMQPTSQEEKEVSSQLYDEFHPVLFHQHRDLPHQEFPTFVDALDSYFSNIEGQRAQQRSQAQEEAARAKLEGIKLEQLGRVDALAQAEIRNRQLAACIEANLELVDQVILVLRSLLASSMDWKELADLVKEEARKGNHLAQAVKDLKLHVNTATLSLPDPQEEHVNTCAIEDSDDDSEDDDDENILPTNNLLVEIDLGLSAHANASRYYHLKKASTVKKDKTLANAEEAFRSAEKKVQTDLLAAKQNKPHVGVTKMRKPFWFEKFMWFVSSEGYLVVAGRDLQQNELLVKKYLTKGDLYVHAEMHGAATVIIKNPTGTPVPPSTLNQAGNLSVCQSRAWDAKILTSAWWVFHHQVSKTAPTGEFLAAGSFIIRGRKNFLAPADLTYGFGLMYLLDSSSAARRLQKRIQKEKENPKDELDGESSESLIKDEVKDDNENVKDEYVHEPEHEHEVEQATPDKYGFLPTDHIQTHLADDVELSDDDGLPKFLSTKTQANKPSTPKTKAQTKKVNAEPQLQNANNPKTNSNQLPRGQRSKLKKIQKKYGDQDEEEREAKMALLASNRPAKPKGKKAKKLAEQRRLKEEIISSRQANASQANTDKVDDSESALIKENEETEEALEDAAQDFEDKEEIRQLLEEENIVVLDDDEAQGLNQLDHLRDQLVGDLQDDEVAEYLVPVSAPYQAMSRLKFKLKLQPGTTKKGKAAKLAISIFQSLPQTTAVDKELIKRIPEQEGINAILAKCKVVPPPNFTLIQSRQAREAKLKKKASQSSK